VYVERIDLQEDSDPPAWAKRIPGGFEITQDVEYSEIVLGPRVGLKAGEFALTRVEAKAEGE
jgi:hypothetical protein